MARIVEIDIRTATNKQLIQYIQSEGKRANTALTALENAKQDKRSIAYQYLSSKKQKFVTTSKSGHLKIDLKTRGKSRGELMAQASVIQGFRKAKTSTVGGTKKHYSMTFQAMKEKQNLGNITQEQWEDIYETMGFQSFYKHFESDEVMELIRHSDNPEDVIQALQEVGTFKVSRDAFRLVDKLKIMRNTDFSDSEALRLLDAGIPVDFVLENPTLSEQEIIDLYNKTFGV